jgi:hypothetical protein
VKWPFMAAMYSARSEDTATYFCHALLWQQSWENKTKGESRQSVSCHELDSGFRETWNLLVHPTKSPCCGTGMLWNLWQPKQVHVMNRFWDHSSCMSELATVITLHFFVSEGTVST